MAVAELRAAFAAQRAAVRRGPAPGVDQRRQSLGALAGVITGYRQQIRDALSADFAVHPEGFADLVEVLGVAGRAAFAAEHLEEWMAPEPRPAGPGLLGTAQVDMVYQPKGVIGLISPWNFPFDLSLGPLCDMLAAGNRVIIKPSEYTPACSAVLREMMAEAFDPEPGAGAGVPDSALGPSAVHGKSRGRTPGRTCGRREPGADHARARR
jgi:coniferyl-aldehyde dehydrogenase